MTDQKAKKEQATGYIHTHYDCPYCGFEVILEGDTRGEEIECEHCQKVFEGC